MLALTAGLWRAADHLGFRIGNGPPDDQSIPFGGMLTQDNAGNIDPATLPTAEDCTVVPLTVDEVLSYIEQPFGSSASTPGGSPVPSAEGREPSLSATPAPPRPIAWNDLEGIDQAHRLWMSCVLAESYFQVWALEDPDYVRAHVLIGTQALSPEDQRAALEDLEANGVSENGTFFPFSLRSYPGSDRIHLISRRPRELDPGHVHRPEKPDGPNTTMVDSCNSYPFTWNDARASWMFYDAPNCE